MLPIPPQVDSQSAHNQLTKTRICDVVHLKKKLDGCLDESYVLMYLSEVSNVVTLPAQLVLRLALVMGMTLPCAPGARVLCWVWDQVG